MWTTTTTYDTQYVITDSNQAVFILYKSTIAAIQMNKHNVLIHLTSGNILTLKADDTKRTEIFKLLVPKIDEE